MITEIPTIKKVKFGSLKFGDTFMLDGKVLLVLVHSRDSDHNCCYLDSGEKHWFGSDCPVQKVKVTGKVEYTE